MRCCAIVGACIVVSPATVSAETASETERELELPARTSRVRDEPAIDRVHLAPTALVTSSGATAALGWSGARVTLAYAERVELTAGVSALLLGMARAKAEVLTIGRLHVAASLDGLYTRDGMFGGGGVVTSLCLASCRTVLGVSVGVLGGAHTTWTGSVSAIVRVTDNVKLVGELDLASTPYDENLGRSFGWYGLRVHTRRIAYELGFDAGAGGAMFNLPLFNIVVST